MTEHIHSPCVADISIPLMLITSATDTAVSLVPGTAVNETLAVWHPTISSEQQDEVGATVST